MVSRDTIRASIFASDRPVLGAGEQLITTAQRALVRSLLRAGVSVAVDDTNLPDERIAEWQRFAAVHGATCTVWDMRDVPVEECILRDLERAARGGRRVGEQVIREIAARGAATWDHTKPKSIEQRAKTA